MATAPPALSLNLARKCVEGVVGQTAFPIYDLGFTRPVVAKTGLSWGLFLPDCGAVLGGACPCHVAQERRMPLNTLVLVSLSLALLLTVAACVREAKLRRALQTLLRRLLERWSADSHE